MIQSENLKKAVDDFGRLSFILETYVKLVQTGDHSEIAERLLDCAIRDADSLVASLSELQTPVTI